MTTSSIRSALDREENRIKDDILRMGSMVESAIDRLHRRPEAARWRPGAASHRRRQADQSTALSRSKKNA